MPAPCRNAPVTTPTPFWRARAPELKGPNVLIIWNTFLIIVIIYFIYVLISVNVRHIFVYYPFEMNISIE
jgi:hypothetical protein